MEDRDKKYEDLERPSVNLQRLEDYFAYVYSSGARIVEQGCRRFDDGTTLPERRQDYSERSDYSDIGRKIAHGFINRIKKELREVMETGETSISIRVSLPNISTVYPTGVGLFMEDIFGYIEAEEGIKVSYYKIGAENDDGSRDLIITASQDAYESHEGISRIEQDFDTGEKGRKKTRLSDVNVIGRRIEIQPVDDIKELNSNRRLNDFLSKQILTISSQIKALIFVAALTAGVGSAAYYYTCAPGENGAKQSKIGEIDKDSGTAIDSQITAGTESVAEEVVELEPRIESTKIYCEISREPTGYKPTCRATGKPKLTALEDSDKTDNSVPAEIKVEMDKTNFVCKVIIEKTQPNEDGSPKIIIQREFECVSSD